MQRGGTPENNNVNLLGGSSTEAGLDTLLDLLGGRWALADTPGHRKTHRPERVRNDFSVPLISGRAVPDLLQSLNHTLCRVGARYVRV